MAAQAGLAASLAGVFKLPNLQHAPPRGLSLFWLHDLDKPGAVIGPTR